LPARSCERSWLSWKRCRTGGRCGLSPLIRKFVRIKEISSPSGYAKRGLPSSRRPLEASGAIRRGCLPKGMCYSRSTRHEDSSSSDSSVSFSRRSDNRYRTPQSMQRQYTCRQPRIISNSRWHLGHFTGVLLFSSILNVGNGWTVFYYSRSSILATPN